MQKARYILIPSFTFLQDLLVDCFKPTEVRDLSFFLPVSHPPPLTLYLCIYVLWIFCSLNPPHVFCPTCLPVGLHLRAARQDPRDAEALHASEEMMASLLILNPPHPPIHLSPHLSSSYRAFHLFSLTSSIANPHEIL